MSKIVTSNIKRFQGTVTLRDQLDFPLVAKWEEGLGIIRAGEKDFTTIEKVMYPLIVDFVEAWGLTNILPAESGKFPAFAPGTSAASIHALVAWLITECQNIYNGSEDPNE